ncbi:programmed cell death 5 [Arctopsyche grandis]|uniref:programmed cell death 5 n=1 Tax=Arctopsyche grandis TaxID=121162 RepID=UPI00406D7270
MEDPELTRIREERMQQLQAQYGGREAQNPKAQEERAKAVEETKHAMLSQVLDQNARARLNTIKLGKPEKGQMVESIIIQMAQRGQLRGKIDEEEFIRILESVNQQMPKSSSLNFQRKKRLFESDEED